MSAPKLGRRRTLDRNKKTQICDLVARSATMGEAAAALGVSIRTVQREARRDHDFDQQLRHAHTAAPDPLKLMQSAARTHWRAAAWLLEREDPERYGRRSASSCSPLKFEAALNTVLEAALEATPPQRQAEVYDHVRAACETAFARVFPAYGPCGRLIEPKLPATPLADAAGRRRLGDPRRAIRDYDDEPPQINIPGPSAQRPSPRSVGASAPTLNRSRAIEVPPLLPAEKAVAQHPLDDTCQDAAWQKPPAPSPSRGGEGRGCEAGTHFYHPSQALPVEGRQHEESGFATSAAFADEVPSRSAGSSRSGEPQLRSGQYLPWQDAPRVARTTTPIIPGNGAGAGSAREPVVLSPKTQRATESRGDVNHRPEVDPNMKL